MKLSFTAATLAEVVREIQPLVGGKIQRISQPRPLQIVLSIYRNTTGEKHLLIDLSARFSRAHLIAKRRNALANAAGSEPSVFCRTARKYLLGGKVSRISQRDGDRILDIEIENNGETFLLSAELMGKHANLTLISPENTVLHAIKLITSRQSRVREILPGQKYFPPPTRPPAVKLSSPDSENVTSRELEEKYSRAQLEDEFLQQKSTFLGQLRKTLKQKTFTRRQLERGLEESARADEFQKFGELILAQIHSIPQRAQSAQLTDYYAEEAPLITVPLDDTLSAGENAQKYFQRARRLRERIDELKQLLQQTSHEIDSLKTLIEATEALAPPPDTSPDRTATPELQKLREEARKNSWLRQQDDESAQAPSGKTSTGKPQNRKPAFDGYRIKRLTSPDGYEVLIGENATSNDALVTRFSHSNDWWLHLRGGTSSHAVIRTNNAPERVPQSTLRYAAEQVVARSVAKHAGWAEVDYTLRKYVRKPRKAAPGTVVITHQKTLVV